MYYHINIMCLFLIAYIYNKLSTSLYMFIILYNSNHQNG